MHLFQIPSNWRVASETATVKFLSGFHFFIRFTKPKAYLSPLLNLRRTSEAYAESVFISGILDLFILHFRILRFHISPYNGPVSRQF